MNIGLIQTGAIGDIIIALPIAKWYWDRGNVVYWPIDSDYFNFFSEAAPYVKFIPVNKNETGYANYGYFLGKPLDLLKKTNCQKHYILYSSLSNLDLGYNRLNYSLKFDEYKYAVACVPFKEKWNLTINRNTQRESILIQKLNIERPYIVINEKGGAGSGFYRKIPMHEDVIRQFQIISIEPLTQSIFDWIPVFENASYIACVDSGPANLIDQMKISTPKSLYLRSNSYLTPVFASGWEFVSF